MTARVAALAAAAAAVLAAGVILSGCSGSGYTVKVDLPDAAGVRPGSRVEIGGVTVGSVDSLEITPRDTALATLSLDASAAPIGAGARIVIRPANLLGEKYVDLQTGDRSHPLPSGTTIPAADTRAATDLDQVLDVLDPSTRGRLAILIHELGVALYGRGADLAATLRALPPSIADTQALIEQVTASNDTLKALLDHAGNVIGTFAAGRKEIGGFVTTAADALTATAAKQSELAATVADAPATLVQLRTTLQRLDAAGAALRPAAAGLRASAPGLTATLQALPAFTTAAIPTLAEIRSVAPELARLGRAASPAIARLQPNATSLAHLAHDVDPITRAIDLSAADLLGVLENWARAIQPYDGASHEFRVSAELTPALIRALMPLIAGTAAAQPRRRTASSHDSTPQTATTTAPHGSAPATRAPRRRLTLPSLPSLSLPSLSQLPVAAATKPLQHLLSYLIGK